MAVFAVAGSPLGHSFSPDYFREKFKREHLSHFFIRLETGEAAELLSLIESAGVTGFCLTRPLKESILPYLYQMSEGVAAMRACNCVQIDVQGRWYGHNTDATGFWNSLPEKIHTVQKALILGNGGAAKAVLYALQKRGIDTATVTRTPGTGHYLFEEAGPELLAQYPLIVNTTPLGTWPETDRCPPIDYEGITGNHFLYDLVYNPSETMFMALGKARGAAVQNGYRMLTEQADMNWILWNQPASTDTGR